MKIKGEEGDIDICGRYERGEGNRSIFDVTLISRKGKRYEKVVDIEKVGGENKKIRKSKRPKIKKKKV